MSMRTSMIACASGLLLAGCLKDELPVAARPMGTAVAGQACMGTDYGDQVWYDIGNNAIVAVNSKMDWDLAFECGAEGWHVRLNTSRFMRAVPTAQTDMAQALDTTGFAPLWRIDHNAGSADSTAIGDWRTDEPVYAIELGYNLIGLNMGVRKLRMTSVDAGGYTFELAQLNGSGAQTFSITKDPMGGYVHFNIGSGTSVPIAPPRGAYDLVFTQYTYQFYEPYTAYLVTGALGAFSGARVAPLVAADFQGVVLADTLMQPFIAADDAIGYDWKVYDFDLGIYTVDPQRVFIVQDSEGLFFKLRFTDFYNDAGDRGCPTFESVAF